MNGIPFNRVLRACDEILVAITMKNKTLPKLIELLLTPAVFCLLIGSAQAATPKKLLVVTVTKGFRHSSIPTAEKVLADVGKSSEAFIGMHSASDTFPGFPPYIEMLGGEFQAHPPGFYKVDCHNQDPRHPATRHLDTTFTVTDEIYLLKNFHRETVHGLLTLDAHPKDKTPGDFPIAWCKEFGNGRVFYTSLGHREDMWDDDTTEKI